MIQENIDYILDLAIEVGKHNVTNVSLCIRRIILTWQEGKILFLYEFPDRYLQVADYNKSKKNYYLGFLGLKRFIDFENSILDMANLLNFILYPCCIDARKSILDSIWMWSDNEWAIIQKNEYKIVQDCLYCHSNLPIISKIRPCELYSSDNRFRKIVARE